MTLNLINFVPNTKIKSSEVNSNFAQIGEELSLTQGTVEQLNSIVTVGVVPTGSVFYFAGASVPDGYLLCDGSAVSRSTYATLYTRIGTTYGSGDGSTTFNLPNLKDRYIKGKGDSTSVGETGNATVGDHTHDYSGSISSSGDHQHYYTWTSGNYASNYGNISAPGGNTIDSVTEHNNTTTYGFGDSGYGNHTHSYSGTTDSNATDVVNEPNNIVLLPCIKY